MLGGLNNLYRMSLLLTADIRGFTTGLARAETRLLRFSGTINKFGQSLNRGVGLAFGIVGAAAVQTAADFDRANAILGKIVGETNLAPLTAQAKRLGRETVFLAREASQAQLELAKLGFRADEINAVLDRSTQLATVFGTDLDKTGKTIASTLRQFGLGLRGAEGLENVGRVTDVMSEAFRSSALDLDKLREGLKNVGPTARSTGLSFEKTVALLAVLSNNAVDGSLGGTKLRSTLSDLAKQFPDVAEGLDSLGDQTLTYSDLLDILNKRAALVGAIFNKNQVEIEGFERALLEAAGATDELSKGIENQFFFQLDKLKNAFQAVGTEIGYALAPTVESLADSFSSFAESLEKMDDKKLERIASTLSLFVGLGVASQTLGFLGISMGRISKVSKTLGRSLSVLNRPLNLFSAALDALIFRLGAKVAGVTDGSIAAFFARNKARNMVGGLAGVTAAVYGLAEAMGALMKLTLGGEVFGFSFVSNRNLQQETRDAEKLSTALRAAKTQEEARNRLAAERTRPSQTFDDLIQFTEVDNIKDAREEITFFQEKLGEAEDRLNSFAAIGKTTGSEVENLKDFIADTNLEIGALERLISLLEKKAELEATRTAEVNLENLIALRRQLNSETSATQQIMDQLAKAEADARGEFFVTGDDLRFAQALQAAYHQAAAALNAVGEVELSDQIKEQYLQNVEALAISLSNSADNSKRLADNLYAIGGSLTTTRTLVELFERLEKFDLKKVIYTDPLERFKDAAQAFADVFGEAFINSRRESERFFDSFKESFNRAFQAVIGKLITLIALYTILAVVSGGASMAGGGKFGPAFKNYFKTNDLGAFLGEGFGIGTRSSASGVVINGEQGGLAQVAVRGAVSGNNLVILNQTGPRSVDRTFG